MRTLSLALFAMFFAIFSLAGCKSDKPVDNSAKTETNKPAPAPTPAADPFEEFLTAFKAAVAANDGEQIAALMQFPLNDGIFTDKAAYLEMHNSGLFDKNYQEQVAACKKSAWVEMDTNGKKSLGMTLFSPANADGVGESSITISIEIINGKYKIVGMQMAG